MKKLAHLNSILANLLFYVGWERDGLEGSKKERTRLVSGWVEERSDELRRRYIRNKISSRLSRHGRVRYVIHLHKQITYTNEDSVLNFIWLLRPSWISSSTR